MQGACACSYVCVCVGERERDGKSIEQTWCFENATINLPLPEIIHFAEDLLVLDVAAAVLTQ